MSIQEDEIEISDVSGSGEYDERTTATAADTRLLLAKKIITNLKNEISSLERLLTSQAETEELETLIKKTMCDDGEHIMPLNEGKIIEGVFDGQGMIGADGRQYTVPPNYASKSKLVEGDILKLTIQSNGTFLYKQIGPIERQRVVGTLARDEMTNDWRVLASGKKYWVLTAAVSFHKGDFGDDAVILIPKSTPSKWAAVENIVKREI